MSGDALNKGLFQPTAEQTKCIKAVFDQLRKLANEKFDDADSEYETREDWLINQQHILDELVFD